MSQRYLVALVLDGQPGLVVGAGTIATGKITALLACGTELTVVAPVATEEVSALANAGSLVWHRRRFEDADLEGCFLVVAATDDPALHERIAESAARRRMLCNIVDVPELCTFTVPAIHRDGPITVAVSTAGTSPTIAKRLRDEIAEATRGYGALAQRLQLERAWSREALATYEDRQRFFESIVLGDPDPRQLAVAGAWDEIEALIQRRRGEAHRRGGAGGPAPRS